MLSPEDIAELKALRLRKARLKQLWKRLASNPGGMALSLDDVALLHGISVHQVRSAEFRGLAKARAAYLRLTPATPAEPQP